MRRVRSRRHCRIEIVADEHPAWAPSTSEGAEHALLPPPIDAGDIGARCSVAHQFAGAAIKAVAFADLDDGQLWIALAQRPAEADFAFFFAAKPIAGKSDENAARLSPEPLTYEIGSRLAGSAIVDADIGEAETGGEVGDEGYDRDTLLHQAPDGRRHLRLIGCLEQHAVRAAPADGIDQGHTRYGANPARWCASEIPPDGARISARAPSV